MKKFSNVGQGSSSARDSIGFDKTMPQMPYAVVILMLQQALRVSNA